MATNQSLDEEVRRAAEVVRRGGVIVYPTDTVWGIGCDATNAEAVKKVFALKERADHKAMIVLVGDVADVGHCVKDAPDIAFQMLEANDVEGARPTTIVYDHAAYGIDPALTGPGGSLGLRVTREEFSQALCRRLRRPLVSTSANKSGEPTPGCFAEISPEILAGADYVVDYRRDDAESRLPSAVIKLGNDGSVAVLRS